MVDIENIPFLQCTVVDLISEDGLERSYSLQDRRALIEADVGISGPSHEGNFRMDMYYSGCRAYP